MPNDFTTGDRLNFAGFRFNSSVINDNDLWGFRVDYHPLANHQFEAVFSQFHSRFPNDTFNDIGEPFPGLPGGGQRSLRQLGSFAWRWTPRATLNNEFRWGFQQAPVAFINREPFASGFRLNFPLVTDPVRNFLNQGRNSPVFEWIDNATWVKGSHSFRFGGQWRRVHVGRSITSRRLLAMDISCMTSLFILFSDDVGGQLPVTHREDHDDGSKDDDGDDHPLAQARPFSVMTECGVGEPAPHGQHDRGDHPGDPFR